MGVVVFLASLSEGEGFGSFFGLALTGLGVALFISGLNANPIYASPLAESEREVVASQMTVTNTSKDSLVNTYGNKRLWSVYNRNTNGYENHLTYKEAEAYRDKLIKQNRQQSRLFLEVDSFKTNYPPKKVSK